MIKTVVFFHYFVAVNAVFSNAHNSNKLLRHSANLVRESNRQAPAASQARQLFLEDEHRALFEEYYFHSAKMSHNSMSFPASSSYPKDESFSYPGVSFLYDTLFSYDVSMSYPAEKEDPTQPDTVRDRDPNQPDIGGDNGSNAEGDNEEPVETDGFGSGTFSGADSGAADEIKNDSNVNNSNGRSGGAPQSPKDLANDANFADLSAKHGGSGDDDVSGWLIAILVIGGTLLVGLVGVGVHTYRRAIMGGHSVASASVSSGSAGDMA